MSLWRSCRTPLLGLLTLSLASCGRPPDSAAKMAPAAGEQTGKQTGKQAGEHPLIGSPAPNIESVRLDTSRFNLHEQAASHSVILLDFWATWCGPCILELPTLMKLAEEYQSKGVALYAVNLQEESEAIREFLQSKGWNLNVVLDPNAQFGRAYGVESIPFLVLIAQDGTVKKVHVGYNPDVEQQLRAELDGLLAASPPAKNEKERPATKP